MLALREGLLCLLLLAASSLELVGAASDGDCQLNSNILIVILLIFFALVIIEVHQIDHITFIAISFLRLRYEGILEVLLAICATLATNLIHVVAILVDDL